MLSLYTLKSAADASKYYQQGDYYTKGGADEHSLWLGKGAERLGLNGRVDFNTFKSLLEGHLPNGQVMSQVEKGQYHRPGYDLTFSAPKSVSILALVAGNQKILEAHRKAVKETVEKLENKYAGCRNKENGVINIERTKNFTVAAFEHSDSREGDPNLHTHCVLTNMTQRADGNWRTVYADELYNDKLLNGMAYRSALAHELMALGYEIEIGQNGLFEIKGIDKHLLTAYSKRRSEIEQWLKDNQRAGGKAAADANFLTRAAKVHANPQERQERWIKELGILGSSLEQLNAIAEQAKERGPVSPPDPLEIANKAVHSAVRHLSERKAAFSFQELVKTSKLISLLSCHEGDLLDAIEQRIHSKELIYLEDKSLTTPEVQQSQRQNIEAMQAGKGQVSKMSPAWIAGIAVAFKTHDTKERQVLIELLTSKDRQALLSSNSKITLERTLKNYIDVSQAQGFYPRVVTQNKINVEPLKNKLGIERVNTIEGLLLACEERVQKRSEPANILEAWDRRIKNYTSRDIWIVNGDISSKQLNRLGQFAEKLGARIVFTQLKSISALEPLKNNGIAEIKMNSTQNSIHHLKTQEQLLKNIERLEHKGLMQETHDYEQRQKLAVQQYLNTPGQDKVLVALSHAERSTLNNLVREQLNQAGVLINPAQNLQTLRPLNMSIEEKRQLHLYQPGDVVRINKDLDSKLIKDSYFTVYKIDLENKYVELRNASVQVLWHPEKTLKNLKDVEVFKPESRALQKGDILIWNRTVKDENNKELNRIKGQTAVVTEVNENQINVKLPNDQTITLNTQSFREQHWDYGYAVHLKDLSLGSVKNTVVSLQSKQLESKNIELLNDLLNAAKEGIRTAIICNDITEVKKTITIGGNVNQLDTPREVQYDRKDALENYQTLATQPLFNRLQSEYLKINQSNPDMNPKPLNIPITPELRIACDIVDKVSVYHAERDAAIKLDVLKEDVIKSGGLAASVALLEKAVDLAIEQGWLIKAGENEHGEALVTAKHTLLIEQKCIEKMQAGKNQLQPILNQESAAVKEIIEHKRLTDGQKAAIQLIVTTQDRMVAVQGIAGAGKTTALKEINRLCTANNYTMVLANTASAKNQAKSASGIEAKTTAQFLTRMETAIETDLDKAKKDFGGNRLFILDESSLASSRDLLRLQIVIEKLDARLALVGDFKQQGSIGAGLIFHDLLAYGINKAVMQENVRLSSPTAFTAMKQAYAGDMAGTLKILKDSIEEIPNKQEALNRMVDVYTAMSFGNKEPPLVITPLNQDRQYVNEAIRKQLKHNGILAKKGFEVSVFVPTDKREINKSDIFSYQEKDVIRFNTNHPRLGLKAGDYAYIQNIDLENQRLTLKIDGKQEFYWSPKNLEKPSAIEIYHQEKREFCEGDMIVFKRNNEQQGIFNGDRASITKIEQSVAEILLGNGNIISLDLNQTKNQHLDYGYALTTYAAQGKDVPFVIAYGEGPKTREIVANQLKVRDTLVLPKEKLPKEFNNETSKVVKLIGIEKGIFKLVDREGNQFEVKTSPKEKWDYFPNFGQRKPNELPLSASQEAFLIQITRGDGLFLIVPYIDDLQKTLEAHQQLKRSALSYIDPEWQKLHEGINRLFDNIKGKAEEKIKSVQPKSPSIIQDHLTDKQSKQNTYHATKQNNFIDKDELEFRLNRDMLSYASQWLGSPSFVTGKEARWGNKGSFSLILNGPKASIWNNWETGQKGKGLVSLYMALYGVQFKEAVQELGRNLNLAPQEKSHNKALTPLEEKTMKLKRQEEIENDQKARVQDALNLYHKAVSIKGTLAEKYLKEHRGITGDLPNDFRFLKADKHFQTKKYLPALVAPYKDKEGNIVGIVRIYLNKDGSKYKDTFEDKNGKHTEAASKANRGISAHGSVMVQEGIIPRTLWIAEGVETALSVAKALPNQTVLASLSAQQLPNVPISPETKKAVICADNDPSSSNTKQSVIKAVESFLSQGVKVSIALPPEAAASANTKGYDFNDLLKEQGIQSVQKCLEQMVEINDINLLKTADQNLSNTLKSIRLESAKINEDYSKTSNINREENSTVMVQKTPPIQERTLEKEMER